ncbi:MAG: hypothetical protein QM650_15175 [Microlunatus sp.]
MVVAAFVAPYLLEATSKFVLSAAAVPGVRLTLITTEPADRLPPALREAIVGHWQVANALDPDQIVDAVRGLSAQLGPIDRLIGALEQLQVPLAQARAALGIKGMSKRAAVNVGDKSQQKEALTAAGVPCARHQLVRHTADALAFRELVGYPMVAKSPDGAGVNATFRLDNDADFDSWLIAARQGWDQVWLLEEFLTGREHSFDSVTLGGETVWASISDYRPPPLEVSRTPWVQWTVLLPRDVSGPEYAGIRTIGPAALRALDITDAFSHLEWFERPDGSVAISEVGGRPPSAQLAAMIGFSYDIDFHATWAEVVLKGTFEPPERKYASGTAHLRGMGHGQVRAVHGIDRIQREFGHLIVESRLPQPGQPASTSYEGEGFITVRHPDTDVVQQALNTIISMVRVELVESQ